MNPAELLHHASLMNRWVPAAAQPACDRAGTAQAGRGAIAGVR